MMIKNNMILMINHYDKNDDFLVKQIPINNCSIEDVEEILLELYPKEKHISKDKNGNKFLNGAYSISLEFKNILKEKFNIDIDIDNFDCQIEEEYE